MSKQRKYRSWTAKQKLEIVLAGLKGDRSVRDVCREHGIVDGRRPFIYDLADRLVATTAAGATTSYAYDGDGNRLSETTGSSTTAFLWDANNSLPQLALERGGAGTVVRSYVYGRDTISLGSGGGVFFYHFDGLGSVVDLTDASGLGEWSYAYEPYGEERTAVKVDPGAPENPLCFTGEYRDESGLYNLRAREYDSGEGRFALREPQAQVLASPAESSYAYAANKPGLRGASTRGRSRGPRSRS